ncbi:hypothetical protein EI94DRAFT_933806 [Lactarius quietus]|nr:hypothetical protein EI94DRAFT_933806 [Lactarius quietus]
MSFQVCESHSNDSYGGSTECVLVITDGGRWQCLPGSPAQLPRLLMNALYRKANPEPIPIAPGFMGPIWWKRSCCGLVVLLEKLEQQQHSVQYIHRGSIFATGRSYGRMASFRLFGAIR